MEYRRLGSAGILTGKYNDGIPKGSRIALPGYEWLKDGLTPNRIAAVRRLAPVASELGATTAQLALAWCAHNTNVSTVITGSSRPEQVKENMKAMALLPKLTPEVIAKIEDAVKGATDL